MKPVAETNLVHMPSRLDTLKVLRLSRGDLLKEFRHLRPGEVRLTHFGLDNTMKEHHVVIFEDKPFTILLKNTVGFTGFVGGRVYGAPFMCREFKQGDYCGADAVYIFDGRTPLCATCAQFVAEDKLQVIEHE